ncbi:MAG: tRNA pseudouridine32 synthase/23S rRNA pseudouridine746 synthase, partial [Polaromonas sp.]
MTDAYNPPTSSLVVLHEDAQLLLLEKPAGLLSVPGKGEHLADCLMARAQRVFPGALLVHRLDRDTSGVMVFAMTPSAQRHLGLQFEKRYVKKIYVARVSGTL